MMRKSIVCFLLVILLVVSAIPAFASVKSGTIGYINCSALNIRSEANSTSKVLRCPRNGEKLTILGEKGSWYYVCYNNVVYGYAYKKYVTVKSSSSSSSSSSSAQTSSQSEQSVSISELSPITSTCRKGDRGSNVVTLQQALKLLGYYTGSCDGIFGPQTEKAVKAFQKSRGLTCDGIVGKGTIRVLFGNSSVSSAASSTSSSSSSQSTAPVTVSSDSSKSNGVQELDWFAGGQNLIRSYKNSSGNSFSILDCNTGVTWKAFYINGVNHADVIPASSSEYAKLQNNHILGNAARRPVIVTLNGTRYAGSMYAVPHGETDYCDYFKGVVCLHFSGSKTHATDNVDSGHQAAIQSALGY